MCWGEGVETKERKGRGRGRLSPGKKMAPLGPSWARLPATQGPVAGRESRVPARLPAMLVAALLSPQPPTFSFRGRGPQTLLPCVT